MYILEQMQSRHNGIELMGNCFINFAAVLIAGTHPMLEILSRGDRFQFPYVIMNILDQLAEIWLV